MNLHFRRNVITTAGFFAVRFAVALMITFVYILVAAGIQYAVVGVLGESTFNYIMGGLLSLFLGAVLCGKGGALIFMFVRGWHVAALAYVNKIRRSHAPAVTVGMKAFSKNIIGFGAVYGIRVIVKNLLVDFKDKLWELLSDIPLAQKLQQIAENPIVEHLALDVLNYGFDATIFYLIRNPPDDIDDIPSTVSEGLKRYLYCLPSIMVTSLSSYILFGLLPKVCKWLFVLWVLLSQGVCAGILIMVLLWPIFYVLDNAFFNPLTMIMLISCFSKQYDKEIDLNSIVVQTVNSILEDDAIDTNVDSSEDAPESEEVEEQPERRQSTSDEDSQTSIEDDDVPPPIRAPSSSGGPASWARNTPPNAPPPPSSDIPPREESGSLWDDVSFDDGEVDSSAFGFDAMLANLSRVPPFREASSPEVTESEPQSSASSLSSLLRGVNNRDLNAALNGGSDEEGGSGGSSFQDFSSGGDFSD